MAVPSIQPQMDADERRSSVNSKTERILGAAYRVSNVLGCGFLEKVYENALAHELRKHHFEVKQQWPLSVHYEGITVGHYFADLLIDDEVLIEIKAVKCFDDVHLAQCLNYLKATGIKVCLLLNFGTSKVDVKRIVNGF